MRSTLTIGEFSRATHLSVKTLRHYHYVGLLEPVEVDSDTGYRRYALEQIPTAQVIRRFRDLDMPLDEIHAVLDASDLETRNELIARHLARLETNLARTENAVASLRNLLERPGTSACVEHRRVGATPAAAITEIVDRADALTWLRGALGELAATLTAQRITAIGPAGGIFTSELFEDDRGPATIFVPGDPPRRTTGRVVPLEIPSAELATVIHAGAHTNIDQAYGTLAIHVTQHAIAIDGPIREYYNVGPTDTPDETLWRTEVGWPIFETAPR